MINSKKYQEGNGGLLQRKNKAIKDCKEKYDKIVSLIEGMNEQNASAHKQVQQECEKINETLIKLKQRSKEYMRYCVEALVEQKKNPEITCVSELASYLKAQKQLLKSITEQKDVQKVNIIDLHDMLGKLQLQRALRRLKRQQLEQQLKFLESNVLVKGNFIYNPASSLLISPAEEKESFARMQNLVEQLQRVIRLSIPCAVFANNTNKLALLNSQQSRIGECERILEEQHSKILRFTKFIEDSRNFDDKFSYGEPYAKESQQEIQVQDYYQEMAINVHEVDEILGMNGFKPLVINLDHPFNNFQMSISQLRAKVKKIEKYSQ